MGPWVLYGLAMLTSAASSTRPLTAPQQRDAHSTPSHTNLPPASHTLPCLRTFALATVSSWNSWFLYLSICHPPPHLFKWLQLVMRPQRSFLDNPTMFFSFNVCFHNNTTLVTILFLHLFFSFLSMSPSALWAHYLESCWWTCIPSAWNRARPRVVRRVINCPHFPGTVLVLALKVPCSKNCMSLRPNGIAGHPSGVGISPH